MSDGSGDNAHSPADLIGNPVALAIESCLTELSVLHEAHCLPGRSAAGTQSAIRTGPCAASGLIAGAGGLVSLRLDSGQPSGPRGLIAKGAAATSGSAGDEPARGGLAASVTLFWSPGRTG